ncbi:triose-phosphate isomerase [Sphingomonas sp. 28-63-12]|uniref:triose-phosphate isomerase n=1 Tax=Sphingomonas sp. 28-63-12 TaxID=1970434 RepID=UPI000BD2DDF2|nr:MAG: triose-phosphate isomerase [Sphingomonas sp. 28-63-12]
MRRKLVAGNWKMNGCLATLGELDAIANAAVATGSVDVAVAVAATLIAPAVTQVPGLMIGAQDVHGAPYGAHTGCISAAMVREAGARFTIVGHSERRADQGESNADVRAKARAAQGEALLVILCVGETLAQREAGNAEAVVTAQLAGSLPDDVDGAWLSVAYEPIWAIGTGRVAEVDDVAAMHAAIRAALTAKIGARATAVRILYGGSVTPDNAADLLATANVDGALVGGASLRAATFVPIIAAAASAAAQPAR